MAGLHSMNFVVWLLATLVCASANSGAKQFQSARSKNITESRAYSGVLSYVEDVIVETTHGACIFQSFILIFIDQVCLRLTHWSNDRTPQGRFGECRKLMRRRVDTLHLSMEFHLQNHQWKGIENPRFISTPSITLIDIFGIFCNVIKLMGCIFDRTLVDVQRFVIKENTSEISFVLTLHSLEIDSCHQYQSHHGMILLIALRRNCSKVLWVLMLSRVQRKSWCLSCKTLLRIFPVCSDWKVYSEQWCIQQILRVIRI